MTDYTKKLEIIAKAYSTMEKQGKVIYILDENIDKDIRAELFDIQNSLDEGISFDLRYEIMARACDIIVDNAKTAEDLENLDLTEHDSASVYTNARLAYLTSENQYDISDIMREYECEDIATACAIWYDNMVENAVRELKAFILK